MIDQPITTKPVKPERPRWWMVGLLAAYGLMLTSGILPLRLVPTDVHPYIALVCFLVIIFYLSPIYLQQTLAEIQIQLGPEGIAIIRRGKIVRELPWSDISEISRCRHLRKEVIGIWPAHPRRFEAAFPVIFRVAMRCGAWFGTPPLMLTESDFDDDLEVLERQLRAWRSEAALHQCVSSNLAHTHDQLT